MTESHQIEDIINPNTWKISYDDIKNKDIIDTFVLQNLHVDTWSKLLKKLMIFKREHKIELRKLDLIASYKSLGLSKPSFYRTIMKKAMRSQSGVLVVTIFTAAHPSYYDSKKGKRITQKFSCKHNCYFCPLEPAHEGNNWTEQPRSYLTKEPGVLRANSVNYDCVSQVYARVNQYLRMGHDIDKLEVLVLGGTFSEYPEEYQREFVRDAYYAANTVLGNYRKERFPLETEILLNENTNIKIIGLTLETRPDTITLKEIQKFRSFGCTRVQMGLQHTDDAILKKSNRGHTINDTIKAISLLKNNCYKIDLHLMPNLLGSNPEKDIEMFNQVLYNPLLQCDQIKIYPVSVVPWSVYEKLYKNGKYKPYSDEELQEVILYAKRRMHPWIRLNRVIRDIPLEYISGGCKRPNMRQDLSKISGCRCIRCREVKGKKFDKMFRKVRTYESSNGKEIFISYESKDEKVIYGFLRLRIPHVHNHKDVLKELHYSAHIRELHVYGELSVVGQYKGAQHKGIGTKLLRDAELFTLWHGLNSIACISGIGVRNFYRKRGYSITTTNGYVKKTLLPFPFFIILYMIQFMRLLLLKMIACYFKLLNKTCHQH
jgi:ELP3 family radical SAM enzyme/protein acetyltransferase|tara:strand:- start:1094 stop:2893 length:1800 start_codon:yes stop_codon:yes gene_type:complete